MHSAVHLPNLTLGTKLPWGLCDYASDYFYFVWFNKIDGFIITIIIITITITNQVI